jgi:hypothetical protein
MPVNFNGTYTQDFDKLATSGTSNPWAVDNNDVGNDRGLAIDNFSLSSIPTISGTTPNATSLPPDPIISIAATANASEAGSTNGGFRISRTGATTNELRVYYEISLSSSATFGSDYDSAFYKDSLAVPVFFLEDAPNSRQGYVTIPVGSTFVDIPTAPIDDKLVEGDEDITIVLEKTEELQIGRERLSPTYSLGNNYYAKVKIVDNDVPTSPTILVAATNPNATEFDGSPYFISTPPGVFRIIRTGDTTSAVTVNYTLGGTATNGVDYNKDYPNGSNYNKLTGTATIAAGEAFKEIDIYPVDDKLVEGDEDVILTLTAAPTSYALGTATAKVTIVDKPTISIEATSAFTGETISSVPTIPGIFRIARTGSTTSAVTVNYTISGTATNGVDYNNLTGSTTIAAGTAFTDINITPIYDNIVEGNEDITLTLSAAPSSGYDLGTETAKVTIVDPLDFATEPFPYLTRNDFNGDGKSDILWRNIDGNVATWHLDGSTVTAAGKGKLTSDVIAGTGDFNGDKVADALLVGTNGTVFQWQLNGSPVITTKSIGATLTTGWSIAGTGDFNADGTSDVLLKHNDGTVAQWQINNGLVTKSSAIGKLDASWSIAGTGDFNGDGTTDILLLNTNGTIAEWQISGSAVVAGKTIGKLDAGWSIAGLGDFNSDSTTDLLFRNTNGNIAEWQIKDAAVTKTGILGTATADWKIAGTGDFNGDKSAEVLWRNDAGNIATWQLGGATTLTATATNIPSFANPSWQIAAPIDGIPSQNALASITSSQSIALNTLIPVNDLQLSWG